MRVQLKTDGRNEQSQTAIERLGAAFKPERAGLWRWNGGPGPKLAAGHGMALTLCTQPGMIVEGTAASRCIDAERLSDVAGHPIRSRTKGNRPGCLCAESRDIGAYDTCPHGCVYCYAVRHGDVARRAYKGHDPAAAALGPAPAERMEC